MTLHIGDSGEIHRTVTERDIRAFAELSGDYNSVHLEGCGAVTEQGSPRTVAHGMLSASFISAVLGTIFPGPGTVYLSQNLKFTAPVRAGDTVSAKVSVKEVLNDKRGIYRMETVCRNQNHVVVIDGEAVVMYSGAGFDAPLSRRAEKSATTFYGQDELNSLGLKKVGSDVFISRNAILYHPERLEIGSHVRIDDFTTVSGGVSLGNYIHIAQFCALYGGDAGIVMEDFSGLSSRVTIYATSDDYSGHSMTNPTVPQPYRPGDINCPVRLCRHVIVGSGSVILPGVTIGEGSSVGAMSLVIKSLDAWGIYAGIPARRLKDRSKKLLELEAAFMSEEKKRSTPPRARKVILLFTCSVLRACAA